MSVCLHNMHVRTNAGLTETDRTKHPNLNLGGAALTVGIDSALAARAMRTAISPRLAIRIFRNGGFSLEQREGNTVAHILRNRRVLRASSSVLFFDICHS